MNTNTNTRIYAGSVITLETKTTTKKIVRVYVERSVVDDSYDVHFDDFGGVEIWPQYRTCYGNTSGRPDPIGIRDELYGAVVRAADDKVRASET